MIKHRLALYGPSVKGSRISAILLRDLLDVVVDGTKGALRLRLEGRSMSRGADPVWLGKASDFDVVGLQQGSTILEIEAPALFEAAPEKFAQQKLFSNIDTASSAFKVFEQSLEDAIKGSADSELYDEGLLQTFMRLSSVLGNGITSLELSNGSRTSPRITITPEHIEQVKALRRETPASQAVRIAGQINTIRHSDKMFELILQSGQALRGIAPADCDSEQLAHLFGQKVLVLGKVVFRPSGSILRIEASAIETASGNLSLWSKAPEPRRHTLYLRQPQGPQTGLNKLWGKWPGTETDDQIEQALRQ